MTEKTVVKILVRNKTIKLFGVLFFFNSNLV